MKAPPVIEFWDRVRAALTENLNLKLLSFGFALGL